MLSTNVLTHGNESQPGAGNVYYHMIAHMFGRPSGAVYKIRPV